MLFSEVDSTLAVTLPPTNLSIVSHDTRNERGVFIKDLDSQVAAWSPKFTPKIRREATLPPQHVDGPRRPLGVCPESFIIVTTECFGCIVGAQVTLEVEACHGSRCRFCG